MVPDRVMSDSSPRTGSELRACFDAVAPLTVGLEEEVMLLDPQTLDLAPAALQLLEELGEDPRFKSELPAAHLELATQPHTSPAEAVAELAQARAGLLAAAGDRWRVCAAGVHPFAAVEGELNSGPRYERMPREYGSIARRQLVASLQVHVAAGGADRTLAVYNALRSYLPEVAALAANAAFYDGRDTGMASVRPTLCELLPRQGLPPAIASWDAFAESLEWGRRAGAVPDPGFWWWELRPHVHFGTLEVRAPDAQATVEDAAGVAAFVHCLVAWLCARHDRGEPLPVHDTWRIAENRWSAARFGLEGQMADLASGQLEQTRTRIAALLEELRPLDRDGLLPHAKALLASPGYARQRAAAANGGTHAVTKSLADRFPPTTF